MYEPTGTPQEPESVGECACGAPVLIRKTGECQRCYSRRWNAEKRARQLAGLCVTCGRAPVAVAKTRLCAACATATASTCARRSSLKARPFADEPTTYTAAHARLKRLRGPASRWQCLECGAPAEQWAYRPGGPYERVTVEQNGKHQQRRTWSPRLDDYDPLCKQCHRARDHGPGPALRDDPEHQRRWRRESHARRISTPEGRRQELARKRRERQQRRADGRPSPTDAPHPARAWARAAGIPINPHGRIPGRVLTAWQAAGSPGGTAF